MDFGKSNSEKDLSLSGFLVELGQIPWVQKNVDMKEYHFKKKVFLFGKETFYNLVAE